MNALTIIVIFLLLATSLVISLKPYIEVLEQPDGKYIIIWYNTYTKDEVKREHKIIKL